MYSQGFENFNQQHSSSPEGVSRLFIRQQRQRSCRMRTANCQTNNYQASAAKQIKSALFWDVTQLVIVVPYRRFGQAIGPIFKGQEPKK